MGSVNHLLPKTHVIGVISNPVRYETRYELARRFIERLPRYANFWLVEAQQGDRSFVLTDPSNPRHIQLSTDEELWIKENMQNIAVSRLPNDWEYILTVDLDVRFMRDDWIEEAVQQLQNYQVVQLFQNAIDLGPKEEHLQTHTGFAYSYVNGLPYGKAYQHWHPGYAWGWSRMALTGWGYGGGVGLSIGGPFISGAILGAADHHMALAMIGKGRSSYPENVSAGYKRMIDDWESRAMRYIAGEIGYVNGTIFHEFHGRKGDRKYVERWDIVTQEYPNFGKFDPYKHLVQGWNGLYMIDNEFRGLRDNIKKYFRDRDEDRNSL